jgi:hypothetical protein
LEGVSKFWSGNAHVYLAHTGYFYPPQFLIPLGLLRLLSFPAALGLVQRLSIAALGAVVWMWSKPGRNLGISLVFLGATLGGVELVVIGQFGTAVALLSLSGGLLLAREEQWFWAGLLLGVGTLRLANAVPIGIAMVALGARKAGVRGSLLVIAGGLGFLLPLGVVATVMYPAWPNEYLTGLHGYVADGVLGKIIQDFGWVGMGALLVAAGLVCSLVLWRSAGKNQLAAVLAISALVAPFQLDYPAVFGLPALVRLAGWGGKGAGLVGLVVAIPWLGVALASWRRFDFNSYLPNVEIVLLIFVITLLLRVPTRGTGRVGARPEEERVGVQG